MKRRKELYPISWEHHDALVLGMRLDKGLAKNADPLIIREESVGLRGFKRKFQRSRHFRLKNKAHS